MFFGHQKQQELLRKMAQTGRLPHALIFSGAEGLGKKDISLEFFKAINSESFVSGIGYKNHPDLLVVEPQKKEIVIDQIRDLQKFLSYTKQIAKHKFAIIDQADRLNIEAQNCLLKILEEPPRDAVLILITSLPRQLAKTVLSRCQEIKFYPLSREKMEKVLSDCQDRANFQEIIALAEGKPRFAREFFENESLFSKQITNLQAISDLAKNDLALRFLFVKERFGKADTEEVFEEVSQFLQSFIFYWRIFLREKLGIVSVFSRFFNQAVAEKYAIAKIATVLQKAEDLQFLLLTTNINKRLLLETLILSI